MKNKNLIRFVESFVILPIVTVTLPFGAMPKDQVNTELPPPIVSFQKENTDVLSLFAFNKAEDDEIQKLEEIRTAKAEAIDAYFKSKNMPLAGYGEKMVEEAEKNDLDWRLLPAISVVETTGGRHICKNPKAPFNPFGWGSCKFGFKSFDHAIEIVAKNLGGNNPKTAHYYDGKTTEEILRKYNPPSIVPDYNKRVLKIMANIGNEDIVKDISQDLALNI
ncbi:MAG: hypothetical protein AAB438_00465 [Patescibacteria group bacterium]